MLALEIVDDKQNSNLIGSLPPAPEITEKLQKNVWIMVY